ncbi:MAG: class I SAM-dependent methyltransferase [Nanoarchaeota archaeon]|nr:class I SAM-dependent methyltransferase [Nanoarchaeota archaeon]MBU4284306.1 class I SAM-dependent methyltransferase [Nanoarchaeota archaeon]
MKFEEIDSFEKLEDKLIYSYLPTEIECNFLCEFFENFAGIKVKNILDVGCRYGRHTLELAKRGYNVIGLDISKKVIKIANKKEKEKYNKFIVGDICNIKFEKKFDAIYSHNFTMNYIIEKDNVNKALKNINKSINKGGIFIFDSFYPTNLINEKKYSKRLYLQKEFKGLILKKLSKHKIDTYNQIHIEESIYILNDGINEKKFSAREVLRYYEPEEIGDLLKRCSFNKINFFDRNTHQQITKTTTGIYVVAKK